MVKNLHEESEGISAKDCSDLCNKCCTADCLFHKLHRFKL